MQFLKRLIKKAFRQPLFVAPGSFGLNNADIDLINQLYNQNLTYLNPSKLATLLQTCANLEESKTPGIFIEAGCALGGSAILMASKKATIEKCMYTMFLA
jgi:asparagine synthase (glutamine-hydrolysing)